MGSATQMGTLALDGEWSEGRVKHMGAPSWAIGIWGGESVEVFLLPFFSVRQETAPPNGEDRRVGVRDLGPERYKLLFWACGRAGELGECTVTAWQPEPPSEVHDCEPVSISGFSLAMFICMECWSSLLFLKKLEV